MQTFLKSRNWFGFKKFVQLGPSQKLSPKTFQGIPGIGIGCCNNCPRDDSPRRLLSKGLLSKGQFSKQTFVQGDFCPRKRLLEVKTAHIIFFSFITRLYGKSQLKKEKSI